MTQHMKIAPSSPPKRNAWDPTRWLWPGLAIALLAQAGHGVSAEQPKPDDATQVEDPAKTVAAPPPRPPQVAPNIFEQGPGVLGVSLQTRRKELLKDYPTPALGLTALGLQDLRLSPVSKDDMLALDLNEELEFAFNSHQVPKQSRPILDGIARVLVENPDTVIQVVCHTDDQGDDGYNLRLSERRAEALKAYLVGRGIVEQRLTAVGRGEEDPAVDTGTRTPTRAERAKNRRTELLIAPLGPLAGEAPPPPLDQTAAHAASDETRPPADRPVLKGAASAQ
jgi:outer membrane protein OmpA-like peptidoglycan-associated protein